MTAVAVLHDFQLGLRPISRTFRYLYNSLDNMDDDSLGHDTELTKEQY